MNGLAAVSEAQNALLPVINGFWDAGLASDIGEPSAHLDFHVSKYFVVGVEAAAHRGGRHYAVRIIVDWREGRWKIGAEASSRLPRVDGSYRAESLGVAGRVADTLDGLVADLRAVTAAAAEAFRRLFVDGLDPGRHAEPAAPHAS